MRKKVLLLVPILFALFSLCSCERFGTEIEDMMIIQGVAVDKVYNKYLVTIEMLNNKQSASADSSNVGEQMTLVYSATGETAAEALRLIINKTGNVPIYTHNKVIILGESAAKDDVSRILDFFERDYDSRVSQLICVAKNSSAEDLIRAELFKDGFKC